MFSKKRDGGVANLPVVSSKRADVEFGLLSTKGS